MKNLKSNEDLDIFSIINFEINKLDINELKNLYMSSDTFLDINDEHLIIKNFCENFEKNKLSIELKIKEILTKFLNENKSEEKLNILNNEIKILNKNLKIKYKNLNTLLNNDLNIILKSLSEYIQNNKLEMAMDKVSKLDELKNNLLTNFSQIEIMNNKFSENFSYLYNNEEISADFKKKLNNSNNNNNMIIINNKDEKFDKNDKKIGGTNSMELKQKNKEIQMLKNLLNKEKETKNLILKELNNIKYNRNYNNNSNNVSLNSSYMSNNSNYNNNNNLTTMQNNKLSKRISYFFLF